MMNANNTTSSTIQQIAAIGSPVALIAAVMGSFALILDVIPLLNSARDRFLGIDIPKGELDDYRWMAFWSDWLPLWVGTIIYLLAVAIVLFGMRRMLYLHDQPMAKTARLLCFLMGTFVVLCAVGFLTGISEIVAYSGS